MDAGLDERLLVNGAPPPPSPYRWSIVLLSCVTLLDARDDTHPGSSARAGRRASPADETASSEAESLRPAEEVRAADDRV